MHKTGSSSIQRYLSLNRAALRLFGVYYPRSIGPDGRRQPKHNALFTAISHEADHGAPHPGLGASAPLIDAMATRIEHARCHTAILSAEGLSGPRPDFARAFAPLAGRFDVTVVIFRRRAEVWAPSFYKQMVLSREVRETRSYVDYLASPELLRHLDVDKIVEWWEAAFGAAALKVVQFGARSCDPGPTPTFLHAACLPSALQWLPFARAHANRSLSLASIEVARLANLAGASINRAALESLDRAIGESSRTLHLREELLGASAIHEVAAENCANHAQ